MGEFKALTEGGVPVMNTYLFDETVLTSGELHVLTFAGYTREWAEFIFEKLSNPNTGLFFQSSRYVLSYII